MEKIKKYFEQPVTKEQLEKIIYSIFCLIIFATPLATLFAYTPETANLVPGIAEYLQIVCPCLILTGIGIPSSFFYQGI